MNAKRKVIIDCDPGIDDSLALMLALCSPEIELLGITTVCGNVPAAFGAENALKILNLMNQLDIPVYIGEETPLIKDYVSAQDTHGMDGLGETNYPIIKTARPLPNAVDFILSTLQKNEKVSIIALGPLTNIAKVLDKDKKISRHIDKFVTMGGSFKSHGNCSPVAEYNYWCDPHAANQVYQYLGTKIHMIGLDVTREIVLTPNILEYMQCLDSRIGNFIKSITRFYYDFHWKQEKVIGCVINDPLAVAYFIDNNLCSGFEAYTTIETEGVSIGQTIVDSMDFWKKEKNSYILTKVNRFNFMKMFLERVLNAQEPELSITLKQIMTETKED